MDGASHFLKHLAATASIIHSLKPNNTNSNSRDKLKRQKTVYFCCVVGLFNREVYGD